MFDQKRISAKELFESVKIERLKSELRAEENKNLIINHLKELQGDKREDKLLE